MHRLTTTAACLLTIAAMPPSASMERASTDAATRIADVEQRLRPLLEAYHERGGFPGGALGYVLADGTTGSIPFGLACPEDTRPMTGDHRMMAGSAGKTFFAAAAMLLAEDGMLDLDQTISTWLGDEPWFDRLPNAANITPRMLMNHTSGIPRYVTLPAFAEAMRADPDRRWDWHELLAFVFDMDAPFEAGTGWAYADTNYIVLGMIIERITGDSCYNLIHERIIRPHGLWDVVPTTSRDIPGLACGYVNPQQNLLSLTEPNVIDTGRYVFNPQFEWAGGGFATTPHDLARWLHLLHTDDVLTDASYTQMIVGVRSPMLGPQSTYGLGVMMRPSAIGPARGHSGYFPGYLTDAAQYADHEITLALQVNTTSQSREHNLGAMQRLLDRCAAAIVGDDGTGH